MDSVPLGEIGAVVLCIGVNAFFSTAETALTALSKLQGEGEAPEEASQLDLWRDQPLQVLTTILIGKNFAKIAASVLIADLALRAFQGFALLIAVAIAVPLVLIVGEMIPKAIALPHAQRLAPRLVGALRLPHAVLHRTGVAWLLTGLARKMVFGRQGSPDRPLLSESDLEFLISVGARDGVLSEEKEEMLQSVLEFSDTLVDEIMVPRTDIKAVDVETDFETLKAFLQEHLHSRLPVYDGTIDRILGVFHVKDILRSDEESFRLEKVLRPAHFVPMHMKISDLLKDLQRRRTHLAMVVDEFGGTAGMVTLEDILEEIVGDIGDEYDEDEQVLFTTAPDGSYIVDARALIGDLEERLQIEFPEDREYNSLGGFITSHTGRISPPGSTFPFHGFEFEVLESDERRISKVAIRPKKEGAVADAKEPVVEEPTPSSESVSRRE